MHPRNQQLWLASSILVACASAVGCAYTQMTSYRDPATLTRTPTSAVAVFGFVGDLHERQAFEVAFVNRISEYTTARAEMSLRILPPTRGYDPDAALVQLRRAGFTGALFVVLTDAYSDTYQMPSVSTTTGTANTSGFAHVYGNYANVYATTSYQSTTTIQHGPTVHKPRMRFDLTFVDLRHGDTVWMSSAFTSGNAFADTSTMAESVAQKSVTELLAENLLPRQAVSTTASTSGAVPEGVVGTAVVAQGTDQPHSLPTVEASDVSGVKHLLEMIETRRAIGSLIVEARACPSLPSSGLSVIEINGAATDPVPVKVDRIVHHGECDELAASIPLRLLLENPQHGVNRVVMAYEFEGEVVTAAVEADVGF